MEDLKAALKNVTGGRRNMKQGGNAMDILSNLKSQEGGASKDELIQKISNGTLSEDVKNNLIQEITDSELSDTEKGDLLDELNKQQVTGGANEELPKSTLSSFGGKRKSKGKKSKKSRKGGKKSRKIRRSRSRK